MRRFHMRDSEGCPHAEILSDMSGHGWYRYHIGLDFVNPDF
jgi:hypothetical protein